MDELIENYRKVIDNFTDLTKSDRYKSFLARVMIARMEASLIAFGAVLFGMPEMIEEYLDKVEEAK